MKNLKRLLSLILAIIMVMSVNQISISASVSVVESLKSQKTSNPFQYQDDFRKQTLQSSIKQANYSSQFFVTKQNMLENSVSFEYKSPSYIVKFYDTVSFVDIYNCIKIYNFELLGSSSDRLFKIHISNINIFKEDYKNIIEACETDHNMQISAIPNDTNYSEQWAIPDLNLPQGWEITKGSLDVKVAVIDTGFCRSLSDFNVSSILQGCDITGSNGAVNTDTVGHGTMVTSIIAAATNNQKGMAGVCWNVSIIPYKVDNPDGTLSTSNIISAIKMAADSDCDVINMSFSEPINDTLLNEAIQYARGKGCILVAGAGNDGQYGEPNASQCAYPASFTGVISVASVNKNNATSYFSQHNSLVDVAAPGEDVLVDKPVVQNTIGSDSYVSQSGTSFSCPYVSGIAALARLINKNINSDEFQNLIAATSTDIGTAGRDNYYGWGLINAQELLNTVINGYSTSDLPPLVTDKTTGLNFNTITGTITGYTGQPTNLNIPSRIYDVAVTEIDVNAFSGCNSITDVTIPSSINLINDSAFYSCQNLSSITISNGVNRIGNAAFDLCKNLKFVTIPSSVKSIGWAAFDFCDNLSSIIISNGVETIGDYAFAYCPKLTSITIPASVISLHVPLFCGSLNLYAINVDPNNRYYKSKDGIMYSKDENILMTYPNAKGSDFVIPNNVTDINPFAFMDCHGLKNVTIPGSVVKIGDAAFQNCYGLENVTISDGVQIINSGAFNSCISLKSVDIPRSLLKIEDNVFTCCDKLSSISVDSGNTNYTSIDGVLFSKDNACLISYPNAKGSEYTIPNGVTSVGLQAFYSCTTLKTLTVSKSVNLLDSFALMNCSNLTDLYFEGNAPQVSNGCNINLAKSCILHYNIDATGYDVANGLWEGYTNKVYCNLLFDSQNGSEIASQKVNLNDLVIKPLDPIKVGKDFVAWYKEPALTNKWNFSTERVKSNTTLYAEWIDVKTAPIITINPYTTTPTNKDITVTASTTEATLNTSSHTFTANGSFDFIATDTAGNKTTKSVTINNIDKTAPVVTGVSNNTTYYTSKTITFNEGTAKLDGYSFISGSRVSTSASHTLVVTDTAGNVTTVNFGISIPSVAYQGHVQNIGWMPAVKDGELCGTSGRALRVEAIAIALKNAPAGLSITYRAHVQNIGWQSWVSDGIIAGTYGKAYRVEALEIKLTGTDADKYSIEYQAHVENIGWQDWVKDGATAGTSGRALRVEAIRIRIVEK
jgi:hypothetical protein